MAVCRDVLRTLKELEQMFNRGSDGTGVGIVMSDDDV